MLKAIYSAITRKFEDARLSPLYVGTHAPLDRETHLFEALGWLQRAQDFGTDRGVSYGAKFGGVFQSSYPETTGYILQTFLDAAKVYGDSSWVRRAIEAGDWEIDVQMPSGAVMAGKVTEHPSPAIFNTGQVLSGWAGLLEETGKPRYRDAGIKACEFMLSCQDPDGFWRRMNSPFVDNETMIYNVQAAWGLGYFGKVIGDDRYVKRAVKNAEYAVAHQSPTGWFESCCLLDAERPLTHTLAYATRGVLEIGLLAGREDFVDAARRTANSIVRITDCEGFLPGRIDAKWQVAAPWCCMTGSAQFSIILWKLYRLTGSEVYRDTALALNRYLMSRHDVNSPDSALRGGISGSWPVSGAYGRLMVLNWATKYFVDALFEEKRAEA